MRLLVGVGAVVQAGVLAEVWEGRDSRGGDGGAHAVVGAVHGLVHVLLRFLVALDGHLLGQYWLELQLLRRDLHGRCEGGLLRGFLTRVLWLHDYYVSVAPRSVT